MDIMMIDVIFSAMLISTILFPLLFYQINQLKLVHAVFYQVIAVNQLDNFLEILDQKHSKNNVKTAFKLWNQDNKILLPQCKGKFSVVSPHKCKLILQWFYLKPYSKKLMFRC